VPSSSLPVASRCIDSPVGPLLLEAGERGLTRLHFDGVATAPAPAASGSNRGANAILDQVEEELGQYFAGTRTSFEVPLDLAGTEFQRQVWAQLRAIPFGVTASYGELANALGKPGASRAVGMANNRNPVAIIVPCHRVVGADGSLTGYAGGLDRKRQLLDLEAGRTALL
jgi:methylated-DNA-[protein]-cysteine S-methyltransferase